MQIEAFTTSFRDFLDWSLERDWVGSDLLPHLAETWETWLAYGSETGRAAKQWCRAAEGVSAAQSEFKNWLGQQPEFQGERAIFALFQLAQCREFERWSELEPYRTLPEDFRQRGINGVFLRKGQEGCGDNVKQLVAVTTPFTVSDNQNQLERRVLPINFRAEIDTRQAIGLAGAAALDFLRWRWLGVLLAYLIGGDLIFLTLPGCLRSLRHWWRWQQKIRHTGFYLLIDHQTGSEVAGPSLGLATSLAIITTVVRQSAGDETQIAPSILLPGRLSRCAFTGGIESNGKINRVDGIPEKVRAMEQYPGVELGVIPKDNLPDRPDKRSLEILGAKSLPHVLRRLIPIRKTWVTVNVFLMLSVPLVVSAGWRLVDRQVLPPPTVNAIRTGLGTFRASYAKAYGCEVWELDRITVLVDNARQDGLSRIIVVAPPDPRTGMRRQCLKLPEEPDDWHPEINLPVVNGQVVFDYQYDSNLPTAHEALTVIVRREGQAINLFGLPLNIR